MDKEYIPFKKEYITPDFDIQFFELESVITASGSGWEEDDDEAVYAYWY